MADDDDYFPRGVHVPYTGLEVIDKTTQDDIRAAVRSILVTDADADLQQALSRGKEIQDAIVALKTTMPDGVLAAEDKIASVRASIGDAADSLRKLNARVRAGTMGRASALIETTREELAWLKRRMRKAEHELRMAKHSAASNVRTRVAALKHEQSQLSLVTGKLRRDRQQELARRKAEHRERLSAKRVEMMELRRAAIADAIGAVDKWPIEMGLSRQGFVHGDQLPFHLWMQNDRQLVGWCSSDKFCDAFEMIVGQVKANF